MSESDGQIPHESRARLSNIVAGEAKEALGHVLGADDLVDDGETQVDVAEQRTEPDPT